MISPQNIAIANHHKSMQQWWKIPEYKKARVGFVKRNPVCIRCGRPTTTPGHSAEDYISYVAYLEAEEEKVRSEQRKEIFKDLVKKSQKINNAKRRRIYQELKRR